MKAVKPLLGFEISLWQHLQATLAFAAMSLRLPKKAVARVLLSKSPVARDMFAVKV